MLEVAESTTTTETREGALKMVAEDPQKFETAAGDLNLMGSSALTFFATSSATAYPSSAPDSAINDYPMTAEEALKKKIITGVI